MKEWWKEFELVKCPSVPSGYNIYRNDKCVVMSIEAHKEIIDSYKKSKYTIDIYENMESRIEEIKFRLIQSADAVDWLMKKNKEMMKKAREYDKRRSEEEAPRIQRSTEET